MERAACSATDLWAGVRRVLIGYGISVAIGIVLGVAIGSFRSVEAFFEPPDRVPALHPGHRATPLFLLWLGIGESPEDLADRRRHGLLQHPDDRRRRPRRAARAAQRLVHARRRAAARCCAG